jgi:hypothetical protein
MSIEVIYPSRRQHRSQNPLFEREQRRRKLILMLIMAVFELGLLLVQLFPVTAHADNAPVPAQQVVEAAAKEAPVSKPVRQIQIYNTHETSSRDTAPKN